MLQAIGTSPLVFTLGIYWDAEDWLVKNELYIQGSRGYLVQDGQLDFYFLEGAFKKKCNYDASSHWITGISVIWFCWCPSDPFHVRYC